jgi:hypothetical protein
MKESDAERVVGVISSMFTMPEEYRSKLMNKLILLELSNGLTREPKIDWISEAREVARAIAETTGRVTIEDVLHECPLPDDVDPRVVGGVFRHPDFVRDDWIIIKSNNGRYKTVGVFSLANRKNAY